MISLNRFVWGFKQDVAIHAYIEFVSCRDLHRGLHVQVLSRDLGSELADFTSRSTLGFLRCARVDKYALLPVLGYGQGRVEYAGQHCEAEKLSVVMVDLIAETGVALSIQAAHSIKIDCGRVGENDPTPSDLDAVLSIAHARVVGPDKS